MIYKKSSTEREQGFTLLEVMVAMAIFSIGVLATVAMQYSVVGGNTSGNVMNQEMLLAQKIMEAKKNTKIVTNIDTSIPVGIDTGPYTVDISVSNPIGGVTSRFVTVTVDRIGGVGGHPVTLRTLTMGNGI